jgi:hypothetical protein
MNKNLKLMVMTLMLSGLLAACAKKGGGGSNTAAPPNSGSVGGSVCDPTLGNCVPGKPGYIGTAEWTGIVTSSNSDAFCRMMKEYRLCYGNECNRMASSFELSIETITQNLPGNARFLLRSQFGNGYRGRSSSNIARAAFNQSDNGLQLDDRKRVWVNVNNSYVAMPRLQIVTQFTNSDRSAMSVQVFYRGVLVGTGQMQATPGYLQYGQGQPIPQPAEYYQNSNYYYGNGNQYYGNGYYSNGGTGFSFGFGNGGGFAFGSINL